MELAALDSLQPNLRAAVLAIRFSMRFDGEGLQGAIILDEEQGVDECERMLTETAAAYELLGDGRRASFLRSLLPGIALHFDALARAEAEGALEEFFSPLDMDDTWLGLELVWVKGLRVIATRSPRTLTHPA